MTSSLSPHLLLFSVISLFLAPVKVTSRETFTAEIEILSYEAVDPKKTSTGDCCVTGNTNTSSTDGKNETTVCAAGDCIPSFKVCISDIQSSEENAIAPIEQRTTTTTTTTRTTTAMPRPQFPVRYPGRVRATTAVPRRKVARREDGSASGKQSSSSIRSFWNRIYGTVASFSKLMGSSSMEQNQELYCSEFGDKQSVENGSTTGFPILLKIRQIPKSMVQDRSAPFSLIESVAFPVTWRSMRSEPSVKQALLILEAWDRTDAITGNPNNSSMKLISRHAEPRQVQQLTWDASVHNSSGFATISYRWRLVPEVQVKPVEAIRTTTTVRPDCPDGFTGSECKDAVCAAHCHPSRGYCQSPGECKCKFGWRGDDCSRCQKMPGCVHGLCVKPFECRCEEGWTGMFCDKPTCKLGCHPQNGFCELPGECRCRFGFKGENCSDCSTMPGCQRGSCVQPLDCLCDEGWRGLFCSMPICAAGCDGDHGWCKRPGECRCRVGWTGSNCTDCVPYPGCQHGSCSEPWTCNCDAQWGGITCNEKLDFCEQQPDKPCRNGGTCVSVEAADGSFVCDCGTAFAGKLCEIKLSE